jgi:hypothetical protein
MCCERAMMRLECAAKKEKFAISIYSEARHNNVKSAFFPKT